MHACDQLMPCSMIVKLKFNLFAYSPNSLLNTPAIDSFYFTINMYVLDSTPTVWMCISEGLFWMCIGGFVLTREAFIIQDVPITIIARAHIHHSSLYANSLSMHGQSLFDAFWGMYENWNPLSLIIATHDSWPLTIILRKVVEVPWTTHAAYVQMCISACACMHARI